MIQVLNESNFDGNVLALSGKVVVEFYASWCPHCQRMAPIFDKAAADLAGLAKFYRVEIDESPNLAAEYAPDGFPTFVVFENGEVARQITGEQGLGALVQFIEA